MGHTLSCFHSLCVCLVRSLCDVSSLDVSPLVTSHHWLPAQQINCVCVNVLKPPVCVNAHCSYVLFSFQSLNRAFLSSSVCLSSYYSPVIIIQMLQISFTPLHVLTVSRETRLIITLFILNAGLSHSSVFVGGDSLLIYTLVNMPALHQPFHR